MSKTILNDFLVDVADAIRVKKGTSELINPQDFAEEISTISGANGGGDEWHYYSLNTTMPVLCANTAAESLFFTLIKVQSEYGKKSIFGPFKDESGLYETIGFAVNFSTIVSDLTGPDNIYKLITIGDLISTVGGYDNVFGPGVCTEITKEEFYDLTE